VTDSVHGDRRFASLAEVAGQRAGCGDGVRGRAGITPGIAGYGAPWALGCWGWARRCSHSSWTLSRTWQEPCAPPGQPRGRRGQDAAGDASGPHPRRPGVRLASAAVPALI